MIDYCGFSRDNLAGTYMKKLLCESNAWRPGCFVFPLSDDFIDKCGKLQSEVKSFSWNENNAKHHMSARLFCVHAG